MEKSSHRPEPEDRQDKPEYEPLIDRKNRVRRILGEAFKGV